MKREVWTRVKGAGSSTTVVRVVRVESSRTDGPEVGATGLRFAVAGLTGRVVMARSEATVGDVWRGPATSRFGPGRLWQVDEIEHGDGWSRKVDVGVVTATAGRGV